MPLASGFAESPLIVLPFLSPQSLEGGFAGAPLGRLQTAPCGQIKYDPVAQLVEQRPFKAKVRGSSPRWVTTSPQASCRLRRLFQSHRSLVLLRLLSPQSLEGGFAGIPVYQTGESNFAIFNQENRRFLLESGDFYNFLVEIKRQSAVYGNLFQDAAD